MILDYIKSCASLEVCRQVVVTMDKDKSQLGRLGFSEFKDLIVSLKMWQTVFRNHAKEKTGVLRAERLRDALLEVIFSNFNIYVNLLVVIITLTIFQVGFRLTNEILGMIVLRYMRKDGTLRFGDFVVVILNLTVAFGNFLRKWRHFHLYNVNCFRSI